MDGGYMDFTKLLPKDRVRIKEDQRMEMVNRGGPTFWVPVADTEDNAINSYIKWEQAFRMYMNIFIKAHPNRATELLEYNHIIEIATSTFHWDNMYKYDREFHIHMSLNPQHNWGVILQQAWSLYLHPNNSMGNSSNTPRNGHGQGGGGSNNNNRGGNNSGGKRTCFRFNRGDCPYGFNCKFKHKCGIYRKYGHGAVNCRKVGLDKGNRSDES